MPAQHIEIRATPEAYEILRTADNQQTLQIMKAVQKIVSGHDLSYTGYGFGNCPIMIVSKQSSNNREPSKILLYKGNANNDPIKLWNETMAMHKNIDRHLEKSIPICFDT